ncbi:MAG: hypothetical protein QM733_15100 [Ilumatobacteraceae bacterium]
MGERVASYDGMAEDPDHPAEASALGRLTARARRAAQSLKNEYEAGKRGDDTPAQPIWASPTEQVDAAVRLVRGATDKAAGAPAAPDEPDGDAADEVVTSMRRVDWTVVRAATRDRTSEAAKASRALAAQVDWDRVQPAARRVSMALIGAVASGQLGVGGAFGPLVARAIVDQGGLGGQVEDRLAGDEPFPRDLPADLADVIEATARELPDG